MQIKLKELLENMNAAAGGGEPTAAPSPGGVVEGPVEDGPSVATACPPTPRRNSSIHAAVEAASIDAAAQADFFNPPPDPPPKAPDETDELEATDLEEVPARPRDRTVPPPIPPARPAAQDDAEDEAQTFSPGMLSPLSRRPPSGIIDPPITPPKRDSGLIDVRSMAAAYREYDGLATRSEGRGAEVATLPLPIMEQDGPLLMPQPTAPEPPNRWLYVTVAGLAALLVIGSTVAVTALVIKRKGGGGTSFAALSPTERAALCEADEEAARIREDEERIAAARRAPAPVPGTVSDSDEVTAAEVTGTAAAPAGSTSDDDRHHHRRRSGDDEEDDSDEASSSTAAASSPAPTSAPAAAPAPTATPSTPAATDDLAAAAGSATTPSSADGEPCDEVACLVSGKGCCGKSPTGAAPKSDAPPPDPSLPTRPDRADISAGVASVQSRLQSCGDRHAVRGAVTVTIAIAPGGEVKSATTTQGSAEFQACVAGAIKAARFPATREGAKVSYPVMLK